MPIKHAELEDIPDLVEMAKRMHALTRFKDIKFNEARIIRTFQEVIERGQGRYLALVAIGSGRHVVGGLIGVLERHIFSDHIVASVMQIVVVPEARMGGYGLRLIRAFEKWGRNRGAAEVAFGVNSGNDVDTLHRFATRMGYTAVGANFSLSLGASSSSANSTFSTL